MITYLVNFVLCSGLLLLIYRAFLGNENLYRFNRFYLLFSLVFSLAVPFITIEIPGVKLPVFNQQIIDQRISKLFNKPVHQEAMVHAPQPQIIRQTAPVLADGPVRQTARDQALPADQNQVQQLTSPTIADRVSTPTRPSVLRAPKPNYLTDLLFALYITGALVMLFRFIRNSYHIRQTVSQNPVIDYNDTRLVLLDEEVTPHSFWKYVFISKDDYQNGRIAPEIICHEQTHVRQLHSLDVIIVEILQAICWFNPFIPFYRRAIQLNHEFLADEAVIKSYDDTPAYQYLLLAKASQSGSLYLTSQFNYLTTKKRLIMMTKSTSAKIALAKQFAIIPVLAGVILLFSHWVAAKNAPLMTRNLNDAIRANSTPEVYDAANRIFYAVSNDNDKLYLTARMADLYSTEKVLNEGITFAIELPTEKADNKSEKTKNVSVTFPAFHPGWPHSWAEPFIKNSLDAKKLKKDKTKTGKAKIDSIRLLTNILMNGGKRGGNFVKLDGFKGISIISGINYGLLDGFTYIDEENKAIEVTAQCNDQMQYVFKLGISLKYLGDAINGGEKFKYNVKLNGVPQIDSKKILPATSGIPDPNPVLIIPANAKKEDINFIHHTTSLSGEYALATGDNNSTEKYGAGGGVVPSEKNDAMALQSADIVTLAEKQTMPIVAQRDTKIIPPAKYDAPQNVINEYVALLKKYDFPLPPGRVQIAYRFSKADQQRLEYLFNQMSKKQQDSQIVKFGPLLLPASKRIPTSQQLADWQNVSVYLVWIDGKKVDPLELAKHKPIEFDYYNAGRLAKTNPNYNKYRYEISLMTPAYFQKDRARTLADRYQIPIYNGPKVKPAAANTDQSKSTTDEHKQDAENDRVPQLPANYKPAKTYINAKGYKIEEGGFSANGKTYYAAILSDGPVKKLPYVYNKSRRLVIYKGEGNAAGEEHIFRVYGYKFPDVKASEFTPLPKQGVPIFVPDKGFNALIQYSNKIDYPQPALDHEIQGNVVARFSVDKDHKITDVKLVSGIGYGCDAAVINMLKTFPGKINGKYNNYIAAISFGLFGRTKKYAEVHIDSKILKAPNRALALELTGFGK